MESPFRGEAEFFHNPEPLGRWVDDEGDEVLYLTCDEPVHGCLTITVDEQRYQWSMSFRDFGPVREWYASIDVESEADFTVRLTRLDGVDEWFYAGTTSGIEGLQPLGVSLPGSDTPVDVVTTIGEGQLWFERSMCRD